MAGKRTKKNQEPPESGDRLITRNRKAYHDYFIDETTEAGIVLVGSEIKSIRAGRVNLRDSYVGIRNGEAWMIGSHIAGYLQASYQDHDPRRDRKLLLHRREIDRWLGKAEQKGYTIIPLKLYLKRHRAKVELGLARGKKMHDKRDAISKRDADRAMRRAIKESQRG